ncbi:hybrid sensor histidine kinase/response regulator [Silvimonas iriomotensis]|uniref:histidine kinase n=1 Tax=Silvimonas iriomotensis TaxID=449662 RepID=A0ABQ2P468_9NEIS|nr:hybrid sensor histidine kinase/response regulator [Silvimonas iriomotensis]GGP17645.1 hybrid sensor histidine kinase/response regulator [Silvimonas iriomotensis]
MQTAKAKILVVDDLAENLLALEALIRSDMLEIHTAQSGLQALELILLHDFALALIDVQMPGMNGFELAEYMRGTEKSKHVPIVFVTAGNKEHFVFKGYESGAVDFLHKPLDAHAVRSKINIFVELHQQRLALRCQLQALENSRAAQEKLLLELQKTQGELQQAVRVRDDFMAIASHELKTPLATLKLQNQLRQRHLDRDNQDAFAPDKLRKMIETDSRLVETVIRLIDDMLDVSRIRVGKLTYATTHFDLSELTHEIVERFAEQLTLSNHSYTVNITDGITGLWDRYRLDQVISNLITNAIRYGNGKPVEISLTRQDDRVSLSVRDQGVGIAPQDKARIFQVFERASATSESGGLGLGLFIVAQIVEAHNGRIRLDSASGEGSTFTIELPIDEGVAGANPVTPAQPGPATR